MLVSSLFFLIINALPFVSYNRQVTSTPIVGYQSTSYLSPKHVIEIYLIPQIVSSFEVEDFTISVPQTLFDKLKITGLTGSNISLDVLSPNIQYTYIYDQASYQGKDELSITFTFSYKYLRFGIFEESGTGSFTCKTSFWHFIDKFNIIKSNVHHILTMQTQWEDVENFQISAHKEKSDVIKSMMSSQMEVRVAMAIEHQVNQILGAYVNQIEKQKTRSILISDIAGIEDEIVIDMGIVDIQTNSKGIYGYYNGTISYKDQTMKHENLDNQSNLFELGKVQMIGDVGTIWMKQQFELFANAVKKFATFGFLAVNDDLVVKTLGIKEFDMTVGSWKDVIEGIQKRFKEDQLVKVQCGFNDEQADNMVEITMLNGVRTDIQFSCKMGVENDQLLDMTLRVQTSTQPSLSTNAENLILTPKSHDVSILSAKTMDSADVLDEKELLNRINEFSLAVVQNAEVNAEYYGTGVAVISDEYIEQVTSAQIEVNDGYLQVNWLARDQTLLHVIDE